MKKKMITFNFPPIYAIDENVYRNPIKLLLLDAETKTVNVTVYKWGGIRGVILFDKREQVLLVNNETIPPKKFKKVLQLITNEEVSDITNLNNLDKKWLKHPLVAKFDKNLGKYTCEEIAKTWDNSFSFKKEDRNKDAKVIKAGLRPPQIGSIYAVLSHWVVSDKPAMVVMPTGTGKTEAMLSILVVQQCNKLLVLVPSSVLRLQISEKFINLGILKKFGIINDRTKFPIVGVIKHRLRTIKEAEDFFAKCNVIVSTMAVLTKCNKIVQKRVASLASHLFIDEAHHVPARTWSKFRECFLEKPIIQFTATPFRIDGKHVDGKIVFDYPLFKAQQEGYFTKISFIPVEEYDLDIADTQIAQKAVMQLKDDLNKNYDHIVMARAGSIKRAETLFEIYKTEYSEFNPVLMHSRIKGQDKKNVFNAIEGRKTRIIVCVDMFGEGFDLPQLKIAALHDVHKSLGVVLQFTGRFTRNSRNIGAATFVANIADIKVDESLNELYSEDADWNYIIKEKSLNVINEQVEFSDFLDNFDDKLIKEIPIQNLMPAMSTVIYKCTEKNWHPSIFRKAFPAEIECIHSINQRDKILVIVTKEKENVQWGDIKELENIIWNLYIAYYDTAQNLLFINSSTKTGHQRLAETLCKAPVLITGQDVFKCFHGVNRIKLNNLGLKKAQRSPVSYSMYAGEDLEEGISQATRRSAIPSNSFGVGYENGEKISFGCSTRGKIWSKKVARLSAWKKWCTRVGAKVLDKRITVPELLSGSLVPKRIKSIPQEIVPIVIEWPEVLLTQPEENVEIILNAQKFPIYEIDMIILGSANGTTICFRIQNTDQIFVDINLVLTDQDFEYNFINSQQASIVLRNKTILLTDWFKENPPTIRFSNNSFLENNVFWASKNPISPFDLNNLIALDWQGVDIKKESQGVEKITDSIQYHIIQSLKQGLGYDIIFDDDNSGEAADIITIKTSTEDTIYFELFHCKYSADTSPGARVDDFYFVCGQAQKSIQWKEKPSELIEHMIKRELKRIKNNESSRLEVGDLKKLNIIKRKIGRYSSNFKINIVQPGLSKAAVSSSILELLGATESYLKETYNLPLKVMCSN